jgi:hypothetical protein
MEANRSAFLKNAKNTDVDQALDKGVDQTQGDVQMLCQLPLTGRLFLVDGFEDFQGSEFLGLHGKDYFGADFTDCTELKTWGGKTSWQGVLQGNPRNSCQIFFRVLRCRQLRMVGYMPNSSISSRNRL